MRSLLLFLLFSANVLSSWELIDKNEDVAGFSECLYMDSGYNPQKHVEYESALSSNQRSSMNGFTLYHLLQETNEAFFFPRAMKLEILKNCPEVIPTLVDWIYEEWKSYDASLTRDKLIQSFLERLNEDKIPISFVVFKADKPIGLISLKNRPETGFLDCPENTLWMGSLHVAPEERNKGLGEQLLQFAKQAGIRWGFKEMYFYTSSPLRVDWYKNRGAEVIETRPFKNHTITLMLLPFSMQ